ncbi:MAG: hypothetical protein KGH79_04550 [Patescibacteria group bacterium]|nr:hypothetical protein [Patescibacteria group bacterium]
MRSKAKKAILNFPSHKKNLDYLKLLLAHPEIKRIIRRAREVLKLPPDGLSDPQEIMDWNESLYARSEQISYSKEFKQRRALIKQGLEKEEIDPVMANKHLEILYDALPENYLTSTIDYIIRLCELPANYEDSIRTFIVSNILHAPPEIFTEGPYVYAGQVDRSKFVTVTFYAKLTDADLKELKKYVNNVAGRKLPNFQPIPRIDTMVKMEELWEDRAKFDEVDRVIRRMTAKEIAENMRQDFKLKTKTRDVYEGVREIKELKNKRFKNLGNTS